MTTTTTIYCKACMRDHQMRDRSVPCSSCKGLTWAVHGECHACQLAHNVTREARGLWPLTLRS